MGQLEDMALFARIVDAGGIGKAAEQQNLAKSAVSRRLSDLEHRLGVQLLSRTTRRIHLTDAGQHYYQQALNILNEVETLNAETKREQQDLSGEIKISVPLSFGLLHFAPLLDQFSRRYPRLNIKLDLTDRRVDLIEEGYELAIRIGELDDSSIQARRLLKVQHCLCASPAYLTKKGTPTQLSDLSSHEFLQYSLASSTLLQITDPKGKKHQLNFKGRIQATNGDMLKDMAILGHGILLTPLFIAYEALAKDQLVKILTDHTLPVYYAWAVYPQTRFLSARSRALIDFLSDALAKPQVWESS
jgi:DNA-binding transcriptional LysR family regulator